MKSSSNPADICCVFTAMDCNIEHAFTPVDTNVAQLLGVYQDGIRSFVCSRWINEQSICAPWVPLDPPKTLYIRDAERSVLTDA
jgi:hypothetical protein